MRAGFKDLASALAGLALIAAAPAMARDVKAEKVIADIEDAVLRARSGDDLVPYMHPDTVMWDITGTTYRGIPAVKKHIDELVAGPAWKNFKARMVHIEIRADRDVAFANSIQHLTHTDDAGNILLDSDFRVSNSYLKVNGRWLMLYQHLSFPVDLHTGKVAYGNIDQ